MLRTSRPWRLPPRTVPSGPGVETVAHYEFAVKSLIINSELDGSDFPMQSITDAISLVWIYVGELTLTESQKMPGTT